MKDLDFSDKWHKIAFLIIYYNYTYYFINTLLHQNVKDLISYLCSTDYLGYTHYRFASSLGFIFSDVTLGKDCTIRKS